MIDRTVKALSGWKDFAVSRQLRGAISGRAKVTSSSDEVIGAQRWLVSALTAMGLESKGARVSAIYFPDTKLSNATFTFYSKVAGPVQLTIDGLDLRRGKLSLNAHEMTTKIAMAFVEQVVDRVMEETKGAKQAITVRVSSMGHFPDLSVAFFAESLTKRFNYVFDDRSSAGAANANWNGALAVARDGKLIDEANIQKQIQGFVAEVMEKDAAITSPRTVNALWGYTMADTIEVKKAE